MTCWKLDFTWHVIVRTLQHFFCYETLSNNGMKPLTLSSPFQVKYSDLSSKPVGSSQIK